MDTIDETNKRPQLWSKNFILISIATFLIFCSFQILMPLLPKYAVSLGADTKALGLVNGIFAISAIALRPFIGRELDKRGRKKIYLVGLIIFLLAVFGYIWVSSLILLLVLRLIHGAGWSTASTAAVTMVADIIPSSRRGEGMGYYGLCSILAMAIAPALGLFLLARYSFLPIFILSLIACLLAIFAGQAIMLPPYPASNNKKTDKIALFDKRAIRVSLTLLFVTITYGVIVTFLPLYAEERGIANIGIFFTIYAAALLISRPLSGKYYDKKGPNMLILFGSLLLFIATFMLSLANDMPHFLLSGVLYGLGFGAVQPTIFALAMLGIEPERRGAVNAMVMSAFDMGMGLGAIFLGYIANYIGYANMYLLSSFAPLLGLIIFFLDDNSKVIKKI
ncbi:MAG: MFS transporter [Firmicutes bacterium HGW-Firmicutes-12]|jgi:MFS family permease|nr:MAG: MFS transporter [Firmicutes bacterium HGW-Firmicutes-12]